jgi:hypothetical protein
VKVFGVGETVEVGLHGLYLDILRSARRRSGDGVCWRLTDGLVKVFGVGVTEVRFQGFDLDLLRVQGSGMGCWCDAVHVGTGFWRGRAA